MDTDLQYTFEIQIVAPGKRIDAKDVEFIREQLWKLKLPKGCFLAGTINGDGVAHMDTSKADPVYLEL